MRKYFLLVIFSWIVVSGISQQKFATIDPVKGFSSVDHSIAYYDPSTHHFRITLQDGNKFTRFLFDEHFNMADSFSFQSKAITLNGNRPGRLHFLTEIILGTIVYEVYSDGEKLVLKQPDFKAKRDSTVYEFAVGLAAVDEQLLAIFPGKAHVRILCASFENRKLFLYNWSPREELVRTSFDLPESNVTDENQKKDIPKEARIKFSNSLGHLLVQPLKQTSIVGRNGATLYYTDDLAYILLPSPYNLGAYLIRFDLRTNEPKGTNYFVNTLKDNASDNLNFHKHATGFLYDSLLIIKNASERVYEYYFYNVATGALLKKYSSLSYELSDLIHSEMKQKGSWAATNEKKDIDHYRTFLRKTGAGSIFAASVSPDSITITNLALDATSGVGGTMLDFLAPLPLSLAGVPSYMTTMLPPLGVFRNKIIYAHSRFAIHDLALSKSSGVTTVLDQLLDDKSPAIISGNNSFLIQKDGSWYVGYYSIDSKKIEVYQYSGSQ